MARVPRIEAEALVLREGNVALRVCQEELLLLARDQRIADVLDEAKDIRDVLPGMTERMLLFRCWVQATYLRASLSRS
jgi:hypothetical protein